MFGRIVAGVRITKPYFMYYIGYFRSCDIVISTAFFYIFVIFYTVYRGEWTLSEKKSSIFTGVSNSKRYVGFTIIACVYE